MQPIPKRTHRAQSASDGSELEFVDEATMMEAMEGRRDL